MPTSVRKAGKEDARFIWEIRNLPEIRRASANPEKISWEEHEKWFDSQYLNASQNHCYVLEINQKIAGYCRFDYSEEEGYYTLSIALAPEAIGKGIGSDFLNTCLDLLSSTKPVCAIVLKKNQSSFHFFQKNHFVILREDDTSYTLVKE